MHVRLMSAWVSSRSSNVGELETVDSLLMRMCLSILYMVCPTSLPVHVEQDKRVWKVGGCRMLFLGCSPPNITSPWQTNIVMQGHSSNADISLRVY